MNPLTLGVYAFHEQLKLLFHEPPPGRHAHAAARVVLSGTTEKQLLEAIRLFENQPENQLSFTVYRAEVHREASYLAHARLQMQGDADSVRAFSRRAGAELPDHRVPVLPHIDAFARALQAWADATTPLLDAVCVTLVPSRVVDGELLHRLVDALLKAVSPCRRVLLVKDDGTEALRKRIPHEIRFHVDQKALWSWAREARGHQGPARERAPKLTPEARRALEQWAGRRVLGEDNGMVLRHLLFDAGEALREGNMALAAKKFRVARTYCQMLGLQQERATCAASIGSLRFMENKLELALRGFEEARGIAEAHDVLGVRLQCEMGIGTTLLSMGAYAKAREAYDRCRDLAKDFPTTGVECLRMRGQTFALESRSGDAIEAWSAALGEVESLPPLVRSTTAYRLIIEHLVAELPKARRPQEVSGIRARGEAIDASIASAAEEARRAELARLEVAQ